LAGFFTGVAGFFTDLADFAGGLTDLTPRSGDRSRSRRASTRVGE
jgi:hypothetical protein